MATAGGRLLIGALDAFAIAAMVLFDVVRRRIASRPAAEPLVPTQRTETPAVIDLTATEQHSRVAH